MTKNMESVSIELIGPAQAERYLQMVAKDQRKSSPKKVEKYARAMTDGKWRLSNDAIVFDQHEKNINGQHRLEGVLKSGTIQPFIVARNFNHDSFIVMDRQNTRRTQQFIDGNRSNTLAAIAHYVVLYRRGDWPKPYDTTVEPVDAMQALGEGRAEMEKAVNVIHESKAFKALGSGGFLSFLYWYYANVEGVDEDTLGLFFLGVGTGEGLRFGDPALTFRNRILTGERVDRKSFQAMAIKAIKAHILGNRMKVCRWSINEEFPTLGL